MGIFTYGYRVKKIFKNDQATAFFKPSEIVSAIVNLLEVKRYLSAEECLWVNVVYGSFKSVNRKLLLSQRGFLGVCNEMIAHFDLIAPYYQFCGGSRTNMMRLQETQKYEYRQRAKLLLEEGKLFREEWMDLHEDFLRKFFPTYE